MNRLHVGSSTSHLCFSFLQVRDLEERLVEKEHELKQMKRNLDESEGAIAQVRLIVCLPFSEAVILTCSTHSGL